MPICNVGMYVFELEKNEKKGKEWMIQFILLFLSNWLVENNEYILYVLGSKNFINCRL